MVTPRFTYIAVLTAMLSPVATASAQNSASATVSANVQQPITVTKTNDLSFGQVFPGLNNSVAVTASGAAAFSIQGQASANVNLTFTLPTNISSSSNTLPIASWVGLYNTTNSSASGTAFTPSTSATSATLSSGGALYVFIGATAQPSISQVAGTYTGTATMTVVYF
ncbi:MAG TPA: DUF4402 domain-containing protein [Gemmatimonadaceae bacterium]|jgi:hypothetical protein|nr:DUF4402 domain-containing protein [Gemmatimonadaceae bacterium]